MPRAYSKDEIDQFERLLRARNIENLVLPAAIGATFLVLGVQAGTPSGRLSAYAVSAASIAGGLVVWIVGRSRLEPAGDEEQNRSAYRAELLRQASFLRWFPVIAAPLIAALAFNVWRHGSILSTVLLAVILVGQILNQVVAGKARLRAANL